MKAKPTKPPMIRDVSPTVTGHLRPAARRAPAEPSMAFPASTLITSAGQIHQVLEDRLGRNRNSGRRISSQGRRLSLAAAATAIGGGSGGGGVQV